MAHYLICHNQANSYVPEYRNKLINAALETSSEFLTANLTETKICVNGKLACVVFEHLCGQNRLWNFEEMLKYFLYVTKNQAESWNTVRLLVEYLLRGENIKLFLSFIQPYCPHPSKYCNKENREKRSQPTKDHNIFEGIDLVTNGGQTGRIRKRAFDPLEMMGLFNKMVCNQEIIVAIAEYYQKNYQIFSFSRVWPIKNVSVIWCCLAENLKELYNRTPEN